MIKIVEGSNYPLSIGPTGGCCGGGNCLCPCSCSSIDSHKNSACSSWNSQMITMWGDLFNIC